jgi:4a-hydroxytetrahydrobiopterin dehydratase
MRMAPESVWRQEGEALVRDFEFGDFRGAMAFVNRVADTAEEVDRHPDILVHGCNKVQLTLRTRATDNDHAMAQIIDGLAAG